MEKIIRDQTYQHWFWQHQKSRTTICSIYNPYTYFFYNGKTVLFLKVSRLHSFVFCLLYSLRSSSLKNVLSIFPTAISNYADDIAVIGITHRFACETPKTISSIIIAFFLKHKCCASRKARGDKLVTSCLESQRHFYNCWYRLYYIVWWVERLVIYMKSVS